MRQTFAGAQQFMQWTQMERHKCVLVCFLIPASVQESQIPRTLQVNRTTVFISQMVQSSLNYK